MNHKRSFASDNNATIAPEILQAIADANQGHVIGYGDDPYTQQAKLLFKQYFGEASETFFLFTGTGANTLAMQAMVASHQAIICEQYSHLNHHECGSTEKLTGAKIYPVNCPTGKLTPALVEQRLDDAIAPHTNQPKVIAISQPTEFGELYSIEELRALGDCARRLDCYFFMDGARIANACAAMNASLADMTRACGVDALSLGGTKNGLLCGEALVFLNPALATSFPYIQKQGLQLASKMRFLSVQFSTLFSDDLWLKNAHHANNMAQLLMQKLASLNEVTITRQVQTNAVFAHLPTHIVNDLQAEYFFYVLSPSSGECRFICSFDTTPDDIDDFISVLHKLLKTNEQV